MVYLFIVSILSPGAPTPFLPKIVWNHLTQKNLPAEFIDLQGLNLPICDASSCYSDPNVVALTPRIAEARGIIMATAIYNYDVNAAAKNLIELTGDAWEEKVVGFVCAAG